MSVHKASISAAKLIFLRDSVLACGNAFWWITPVWKPSFNKNRLTTKIYFKYVEKAQSLHISMFMIQNFSTHYFLDEYILKTQMTQLGLEYLV